MWLVISDQCQEFETDDVWFCLHTRKLSIATCVTRMKPYIRYSDWYIFFVHRYVNASTVLIKIIANATLYTADNFSTEQ